MLARILLPIPLFLIPALLAQDSLPVRKVILYKNGMGYFEHTGEVREKQDLELAFPSAQLDDVLKSLTVIDLGGRGPIAGITYDSVAPLHRRLAELPIQVDSGEGVLQFLNKIRGTEVELRTPAGPVAGKLMGAELRRKQVGEYTVREAIEVVLFTPQGELRTLELANTTSLRLLEKGLAGDVGRYLDLLDSANQRAVRRVKIHTAGEGPRQLQVSYTSEAPIWKTTYRLVLDDKRKPLLQGWAIVDNTPPNDWVNVELSLVTGAPVSFIQNISQPLYARRPVVPLPEGLQVSPQMHESTLEAPSGAAGITGTVRDPSGAVIPGALVGAIDSQGNIVRQVESDRAGRFRLDVPPGRYRLETTSAGFTKSVVRDVIVNPGRQFTLDVALQVGAVAERVEVTAAAPPLQTSTAESRGRRSARGGVALMAPGVIPGEGGGFGIGRTASPNLSDALRSFSAAAQAQVLGEQFEYKLRQPVTVRRNQAALLPIVHTEVEGEKVSVYSEAGGERFPRQAVWLKNTSGLTLDAGSFTVLDSNAFAGEGLTETIHPQERRLLSYGLDLGTTVTSNRGAGQERIERIEVAKGLMRISSRLQEAKTYVIRNNDEKARTVLIEHPVRQGWEVIETSKPAESTAGFHRFRVEVQPRTTAEFTVREQFQQVNAIAVRDISSDQVGVWVKQRVIDAQLESALQGLLARRNQAAAMEDKLEALEKEQQDIDNDQERLRENLGKLGQSKEEQNLRLRYVRQLEQQEDRLAQIRAERTKLQQERAAAEKQFEEEVQTLTFDRKL